MRTGWNVRNIYIYLVSFVTLMMLVGAAAGALRILAVDLPMARTPLEPSPLEIYWRAKQTGVSEAEARRKLEEERRSAARAGQAYALRRLVGHAGMLLVAGSVYTVHWRQVTAGD